jgi:general secretion pathway protein G
MKAILRQEDSQGSVGHDYLYVSPGEHGDTTFSYGSDGAKGGEGKNVDITSWDTK